MFWKIKSKEYKELKLQIELLWLELDVLTQRYKRKVTKKQSQDEDFGKTAIDDGFDDLRRLNKEHGT